MDLARAELADLDPGDRAAFTRVLARLATTIESGELVFSINQGRVSDAKVTKRTHVPHTANLSAALDDLLGPART